MTYQSKQFNDLFRSDIGIITCHLTGIRMTRLWSAIVSLSTAGIIIAAEPTCRSEAMGPRGSPGAGPRELREAFAGKQT